MPWTMKEKNKTISDPTAIANHFNHYFSNIANELQDKIYYNGRSFSKYLNHFNPRTDQLIHANS